MTYNVSVPYPFLWSDPRPFFGPFDRRRRPRTEAAEAVEVESFRFETTWRDDGWPVLQMHWTVTIEVNGGFSLRAEWNHLRQDDSSSVDCSVDFLPTPYFKISKYSEQIG